MNALQKFFLSLCFVLLLCGLTSCGRVSAPSPIEGSGYPHNYPANQD